MSSKKKGFVCQNCGKNVPSRTERCPYCGRFFKGVRCPECLYVGEASDFLKGCPACGYLSDPQNPQHHSTPFHKKQKPEKDLPAWFYLMSIGVLVVSIIVLAVFLLDM